MKSLPSFTDLPIADIVVPADRLRPISEAKVAALMQVIEEGVFLGAITVRRAGKVNTLIDGAHRLEAMFRLGRETIRCDVLDCNAADGFFNTEVGEVAGLLGFDPKDVRAGLDPVVREIRALLSDLGNASGVGEQLAAVEALRTRFAEITGGVAGMNEEQRAFYQSVLNTEAALRAAAVATGDVATESDSAAAAAEVLSRAAQRVVSTLNAADGSRLTAAFQAAFPVASQLLGMAQDIVATIGHRRRRAAIRRHGRAPLGRAH
jgi:hypothetical protein